MTHPAITPRERDALQQFRRTRQQQRARVIAEAERRGAVKALRSLAQARRELAEYGRLHLGDVGTIAALEVEASNLDLDADRIQETKGDDLA